MYITHNACGRGEENGLEEEENQEDQAFSFQIDVLNHEVWTIRASARYVAGSRVDINVMQDDEDKKDFPDPLPIMVDSLYEVESTS